ncbi:prostaglandin F2 receptor negative regulator isoform X3 [Candoia aspera]|uniref:prostaglandin F2 receptor negative regulator isoform X3 n=1 Tax=Candoia aspera TaxID=51853 RepID=UPI002FD8775B
MGRRAEKVPLRLLLLLLAVSCHGRIVKVPEGPLIRVEGTEVVIPCNVSQYDGPSEQNFEWEFSTNLGQDSEFVHILSTWDPSFMSQEYQDRVSKEEIKLRRNSNNAVEFVIGNIRPTDQGMYRCTTPSTDAVFQGNYNDVVEVKVIADGLTVRGSNLYSLSTWNLTEGDAFQLRCSAFTNSSEHTHLQVSWEFKSDHAWQEILSLTHEGKFRTGSEYSDRYISGDVRLDAMADDVYSLSVSQALPTDEGAYRCRVTEWVKGADGSWQKIQEKTADVVNLVVKPTSLDVFITRSNISVMERDSFELTCNFTTDRSGIFQTELTWYFSEYPHDTMAEAQVLLSADRDLVISDSTFISPSHVDQSNYHLLVRDVGTENSGYYYCQAALWVPQHNGRWHKIAEKTSVPVTVEVVTLEPNYYVFLNASKTPLFSEDPTELECRIMEVQNTETNVRFTVSWYYRRPTRSDEVVEYELLATMDADWTLVLGERSKQRAQNGEIILSKPRVDTFRLRIQWTSETDRGDYYCVISSWDRQRNNSWIKIKDVASMPVSILWSTQGPVFNVSVHSDSPTIYQGDLVNLLCIITIETTVLDPDDMSFDVSWFAMRSFAMDKEPVFLASLDRKGIVTQARRNGSSDLSLEKISPLEFRLRVHGCEDHDFGNHFCLVTPWVRSAAGVWQQEKEIKSKPILVTVKMDVLNAFKLPLLIGIGLSTVIGLLSCLIGYCSSRWCCKKEVQETRRERRRLMSMEMD